MKALLDIKERLATALRIVSCPCHTPDDRVQFILEVRKIYKELDALTTQPQPQKEP